MNFEKKPEITMLRLTFLIKKKDKVYTVLKRL